MQDFRNKQYSQPMFCDQDLLDTQENISYIAPRRKEVLINN